MPCYIEPVCVERHNSLLEKRRRPVNNPNSIDITETDDWRFRRWRIYIPEETTSKAKQYRYFIFDIECAQEEVKPGRFKHEALLVCEELICTEFIKESIKIGADDNPPRPDSCICKEPTSSIEGFGAGWSRIQMVASFNFDDALINPLDEMLNFLCNHGPKNTSTFALSHNG